MEQKQIQYKQAILIGAAPMGTEINQLLSLLKWAGYEKNTEEKETETSSCNQQCGSCAKACSTRSIQKDVYVIAADGGLKFLFQNNMRPDFWVGDLDSLDLDELESDFADEIQQISHEQVPVEKDDTDMALAVKKAFELGYEDILIYGGCGGSRVSHTLANIQLLRYYAKKGCNIRMMGDGVRMEILSEGAKRFSSAMKGHISVICLSDVAKFVKIEGLKYEYEGELTSQVALGVSNSFVGKDALIQVNGGDLLLIFEK